MCAGCAVVTTNISGNPELIGDCGHLIPPADVGALRSAICDLTRDPKRCDELGRRAAERVRRHFDWSVVARRYLELLSEKGVRRGRAACAGTSRRALRPRAA